METLSQRLNEQYGRSIFAERVDEAGLPVDGFAVPTFRVEGDEPNRRIRVTVGTYRVIGGRVEPYSVFTWLATKTFMAERCVPDKMRRELLDQLVQSLPSVEREQVTA